MEYDRLKELARRLCAAGEKAAHVSASECHEIYDDVLKVIEDMELFEFQRDAANADRARLAEELLVREEQVAACISSLDEIFAREGDKISRDDIATYWRLKKMVRERPAAATDRTALLAEHQALKARVETLEKALDGALPYAARYLAHDIEGKKKLEGFRAALAPAGGK